MKVSEKDITKELYAVCHDTGMGHWLVPKIVEALKKLGLISSGDNSEEHY